MPPADAQIAMIPISSAIGRTNDPAVRFGRDPARAMNASGMPKSNPTHQVAMMPPTDAKQSRIIRAEDRRVAQCEVFDADPGRDLIVDNAEKNRGGHTHGYDAKATFHPVPLFALIGTGLPAASLFHLVSANRPEDFVDLDNLRVAQLFPGDAGDCHVDGGMPG
jgi:hypothetical protein